MTVNEYYTLRRTCEKCGAVFEKLKRFYATGEWLDFELDKPAVCARCVAND